MRRIIFIYKYLKYWISANSIYSVHSPFVYELYKNVIKKKSQHKVFMDIEKIRKNLLKDPEIIETSEFGAAMESDSSNKRKIKDIAKNYPNYTRIRELLFKIVEYFRPEIMLELGTSIGISTMYQAAAVQNAEFHTIEVCPNTAIIAANNFSGLGLDNVKLRIGNFDDVLPQCLNSIERLDYVFIDMNQTKESTLDYYSQCLNKSHSDSLFVFDSIHRSKEMEEAWEIIKKSENVKITIDLFFLGLVLFKEGLSKQDFIIRI